jgi:hypothetical protein
MADCYVVASAPVPSSHHRSRRHRCHHFVIVTAHPHLRKSDPKKKKSAKVYFYLRHNKLKKANLDQVFSESRSGTIAHKNKKRITAVTH